MSDNHIQSSDSDNKNNDKPWSLVGQGENAYVSCPIPEGWTHEIVQGVQVAIPPVGYVKDPSSKQLVYVGVDKKNPEDNDFYWVRSGLPKDYDKLIHEEQVKRIEDPTFSDPVIEAFRQGAWIRRLSGCWFSNGPLGEPTYITGLHYYYMEWCFIAADGNKGYPSYRESDRNFFLFVQHAEKNPNCFGVLLLTKRRDGKTQKSVAFGLEPITRLQYANFGIQSKTAEDAEKVVFKDGVIRTFSRLPDFFKPKHDDKRVANIRNALVFKPPITDRESFDKKQFLGGWVEHRASTETAFDGTKLLRYVGDEVFKTQVGVSVYERWNVVKFCLIVDGKIKGKALLTSTVEEIEGSTDEFMKMYSDSDQQKIDDGTRRTKTGLFRMFLSADEARNRDKYGKCNKEKNRDEILLERKAYADDVVSYNSLVRKEPLTVEEAFRFMSKDSIFDTIKIADQIDLISWRQDEFVERGNYIWISYGKEVKWVPTSKGKWIRVKDYPHPTSPLSSEDTGYRTDYKLHGTITYSCGVDPFSHSVTEGNQRSNGAFFIKTKHNPIDPDKSDMFIVQYLYRTPEVEQFYEDVFITVFLYGCEALLENNKIGMVGYFENARIQNYLTKIKGSKNYGIVASKKTTQAMSELIETYIHENIHKVFFMDLLKDWANFKIEDTQKFDAAMASGYTLLSDSKILLRKQPNRNVSIIDIGDLL